MSRFDPTRKILDRDAAVRWRERQPGRVVFTNGVFDIMHAGHIDVLRQARERGDALVVGINSDMSVRRLKGPERPICPQSDRASVVAAMEAVDAVVLFEEDTPIELIRALRPNVLVKGGDYSVETIVGAGDVLAAGGEVVIIPLLAGRSTSSIVARVRAGGNVAAE